MSVSILIPVLNRPHRIMPLLANIADATPEEHCVIFAASDPPTVGVLNALGTRSAYMIDEGRSWPERINLLFRATDEPYVFLGADDVLFHPGWLTAALETMRSFDLLGGVVTVEDLHNPRGTLALVARSYIDFFGGTGDGIPGQVIHPGYGHCYSDNELFEVAHSRDRWAYCRESLVEHLHPDAGKGQNDSTYMKGMATIAADTALFHSRRGLWS